MDYSVNSIAYHFHPINSNNKLIIYHQGHRGDFILGKNTIQFFLNKGYSVIAFTMPLIGTNNKPIVSTEKLGTFKLVSHDSLNLLESNNFSPLKFFIEPVILSLNYLDKEKININEEKSIGFNDRPIYILTILLSKQNHLKKCIENIKDQLGKKQLEIIIDQKESRLDQNLHFFIRIDKHELIDEFAEHHPEKSSYVAREILALAPNDTTSDLHLYANLIAGASDYNSGNYQEGLTSLIQILEQTDGENYSEIPQQNRCHQPQLSRVCRPLKW